MNKGWLQIEKCTLPAFTIKQHRLENRFFKCLKYLQYTHVNSNAVNAKMLFQTNFLVLWSLLFILLNSNFCLFEHIFWSFACSNSVHQVQHKTCKVLNSWLKGFLKRFECFLKCFEYFVKNKFVDARKHNNT